MRSKKWKKKKGGQMSNQNTRYKDELKENKHLKENHKDCQDCKPFRDVVSRLQKEIFDLETHGWPLSDVGKETLKTLHKIIGVPNDKV